MKLLKLALSAMLFITITAKSVAAPPPVDFKIERMGSHNTINHILEAKIEGLKENLANRAERYTYATDIIRGRLTADIISSIEHDIQEVEDQLAHSNIVNDINYEEELELIFEKLDRIEKLIKLI